MSNEKKAKLEDRHLIPLGGSKRGIYVFSTKEHFRDSVSNANTDKLRAAFQVFREAREKRR